MTKPPGTKVTDVRAACAEAGSDPVPSDAEHTHCRRDQEKAIQEVSQTGRGEGRQCDFTQKWPFCELHNSAFAPPTCSLINLSHKREGFETR
jgi:hypothetical protein